MRRSQESGYTLIELSVAMAVFLIFMGIAGPFLFGQLRQAVRTETRIDLQQSARASLRTLVRELRQANELVQVTFPPRPSGKNKISFTVDLNTDGGIGSNENVTYYVKQSKLYRGDEDNKGQPIGEDVKSIEFTIWGSNLAFDDNLDGVVSEAELDRDGNGQWSETELDHVTRITVVLTVSAGSEEQSYTENVWLRNRVVG